jgi:hypothetical protein
VTPDPLVVHIGEEEVVAVDIGVAAKGANPNEIYSKPIA